MQILDDSFAEEMAENPIFVEGGMHLFDSKTVINDYKHFVPCLASHLVWSYTNDHLEQTLKQFKY